MTDHPASQRDDLAYFNSKLKLCGLLVMMLAMVATCWFCTRLPGTPERVAGWIGVVFFGLGLIVLPARFRQTNIPQIEFTAEGIHEHLQGFGFIPWDDINDIFVWRTQNVRILCLNTVHQDHFVSRLSPVRQKAAQANLAVGASAITLNFSGLTPGLADAIQYCEAIGFEVAYR